MKDSNSDMIVVGKVSGLFGVKGWHKIFSETAPRDNILSYSPWYLKTRDGWQEYKVAEGKVHGKGIIARLEPCTDRDIAALLVGYQIAIQHKQLAKPEEGEYYWSDLIGLQVETTQGITLGKVKSLMETGANDVLVVKTDTTKPDEAVQERLIPFIPGQYVVTVDLAAGLMVVDWDPEF
jgi:16S rRNA processing protein RimM